MGKNRIKIFHPYDYSCFSCSPPGLPGGFFLEGCVYLTVLI